MRFAQGVKEDGLYTRVNGKPVIVIDAKAESGAAMRSTVIHELVLSYDKEKGSVLSVIAQHARLGDITEASLNDSIARFKRFVNDFKQKNKINYDLAKRKSVAEKDSEYMSAVERGDIETAQNTAEAFKEGNRVLNKKLEESRAETERYKAKGRSLARKIAEDAYEEDAKLTRS